MEEVRLVHSVDKPSNLRSVVKQDLRDLGVKIPKQKKTKKLNQSRNASQDGLLTANIFGNYLSLVPSKYIDDCGFVPKFLVEAAEIIEHQCHVEGIFRKSGSITRLKELKQQIEDGQKLASENAHDVTGLIKQFFRELPDPLLTSVFHDSFVRCYNLPHSKQVDAVLLLCLMLPMEHLSTLRFTMRLLSRLSKHSTSNKMDVGNLAVVLAPNIMHVNSRSQKMNSTEEKLLQIQTAIVELLIQNADSIGVVSESLLQRTALMTEYFGTEDELEASDDNTLEDSKDCREARKKTRKRSNSLQGIVSSIGRGIAKLRRSTDGKNNLTTGSNSSLTNESQVGGELLPLSIPQHQGQEEQAEAPNNKPSATPVVIRKRRMSGEVMPFSATKRKAILDQLPQRSTLGATPFTPASTKKHHVDTRETPHLMFTERSQMAFTATPKHDANKSMRKKLNLFSPSSSRKAKRSKSGGSTSLCSSGLRKSGRTKHLFKRLSGGKEKTGDEDDEDHSGSILGVPQSQSAMELSNTERSPLGITRTVSSPSLHDTSTTSHSDHNDLNKGFIDADMTACLDSTTTHLSSQAQVQMRGRTLKRTDSFKPGQKPVRRSASTDGALRRGQPNKLCNGLLEGKTENVKKLRRSFDKSDISQPIPVIVHPVPNKSHSFKEVWTMSAGSASDYSRPSACTTVLDAGSRKGVKPNTAGSDGSAGEANQTCDMESSLLNVVLPPPLDFKDQSMMEVDNVAGGKEDEGSDTESEAGFSTISGGTVIHNPRAGLQSLKMGTARDMAHYGSSVSVAAPARSLPLQSSCSFDSLISTESECSEAGLASQSRMLDRSVSIDSGKCSLLDSTEVRSSSNHFGKVGGTQDHDVRQESGRVSSTAPPSPPCSSSHGIKSLSAEDLKAVKRTEKPVRSHSMYSGGASRHSNIVPNLQISAETHRLLARAGFLGSSLPPNVQDVALPRKSPKKAENGSHNFGRDQSCTRSFRLERFGTFKKDRSNILYSDHPSPVQEESAMEQSEIIPEDPKREQKKNLVMAGEEVWVTRDPSSARSHTATEKVEDVWVPMPVAKPSQNSPEKAVVQEPETGAYQFPQPSLNLKRAEVRLPKHDSILRMKEGNAGRVAQSVQQFNTRRGQSESSSHHCPQNSTRKRGVSPVRIPTIFAKSHNDPSATYCRELLQKSQMTEHCSADVKMGIDATAEDQKTRFHGDFSQTECSKPNEQESESSIEPETAVRSMMMDIDLSSSLMETIEDVITPRRQKQRGQNADGSRPPLQESTNIKPASCGQLEEGHQLRMSRGLTPHQMMRYGPKAASSERSPGKSVKRLQQAQSPHSKFSPNRHSPQKARDQESLRLESRHFHEHY